MKGVSSLGTPKSSAETTRNSAETVQSIYRKEECTIVGDLCLYCKETQKTGDKKICGDYIIEAKIKNKMRLDKCDAYTAKETLGYRVRKTFVAAARGTAKKELNQKGTRGEKNQKIHKQITKASQ